MNRRNFSKRLLATAGLNGARLLPAEDSSKTLRGVAARKGLLVGTAVSNAELQEPAFTRLLSSEANIVVAENDMKWERIHPEPDRFDFARGDALVAFAQGHNQQVRGHNLCWHNQLPAWFKQVASPQNTADLLGQHIAQVAGHFAGQIQSWDVVNEAVNVEDGRPDGLRNSIWLRFAGPEYIDLAFRVAFTADPKAVLTYNDYDLEQDGPKHDAKRRAVLELLSSLRNRKVPIHALGLQSHLRAGTKLPDWANLHRFLEELEALDLQVYITELDVNDEDLAGSIEDRDRMVAEVYQGYLTNVLQHSSVRAVLTWGLTDRDTWLNFRTRQSDKRLRRPLPFDSELRPKPAFYAMLNAITGTSRRG